MYEFEGGVGNASMGTIFFFFRSHHKQQVI